MFRHGVALLFGTCLTLLATAARAERPKVDVVPSFRAPAPISVLTRDVFVSVARAEPAQKGLSATILRALARRGDVPRSQRYDGPRDPRQHDPAAYRDATSLGVRNRGVAAAGAALAAFGLGIEASMALGRGRKKSPFKIGAMVRGGGVGILFGAKF